MDIGKAECRVAIMEPGGLMLEGWLFTNRHEDTEGLASRQNWSRPFCPFEKCRVHKVRLGSDGAGRI
jgi:hypothetical protein